MGLLGLLNPSATGTSTMWTTASGPEVGSLLEDVTYSVRVLAFTSMGDGPLSDPIQVKTQQGIPEQLMNFRAEAKTEMSVVL
ncbi:hypothetical protein AAES_86523 [Amazona aestiva]|uniref:Fibronectin type-III domain-containing protein n=1 Tax=Amazona aestiva TaxID=12930 RepID=A0A0Q3MEA2_AMAAE|nr:hypothetical protein AAES_86523 [Amazona aestiva]